MNLKMIPGSFMIGLSVGTIIAAAANSNTYMVFVGLLIGIRGFSCIVDKK